TDVDTQDAAAPVDYVTGSGSVTGSSGTNGAVAPAGAVTVDATTGQVSYDRAAFNFLDSDQSVTYTVTFKTQSGDDAQQTHTLTVTINGENDDAVVTVVNVTDSESDLTTPVSFLIADHVSQTDADTQDLAVD